mmetsp:Transcript_107955/g.186196  ORF Transcript_107955/g.186196 Transcript_107955/m.186196 type:complete len:92 (-) Transcript_107955:575-850(-)
MHVLQTPYDLKYALSTLETGHTLIRGHPYHSQSICKPLVPPKLLSLSSCQGPRYQADVIAQNIHFIKTYRMLHVLCNEELRDERLSGAGGT